MPVTNYHTLNGELLGETGPGGRRFYGKDALGSVVATYDQNGTLENTYRYKPYGGLLSKTGSAPDPRFMWTGSTGSRTTGASYAEQYNRARHYGSRQAAWTNVDPVWPDQPAYGYAHASPVIWSDGSGLTPMVHCDCKIIWRRRKCVSFADYRETRPGQYKLVSCPGHPYADVTTGDAPVCKFHCKGYGSEGCTGTSTLTLKIKHWPMGGLRSRIDTECKQEIDMNCFPGFDFAAIVLAIISEFPGGGSGVELGQELARLAKSCKGTDHGFLNRKMMSTCHKGLPNDKWQRRIVYQETFRCCNGQLFAPKAVVGPVNGVTVRQNWDGREC